MNEWIDIRENIPENGQRIVFYDKHTTEPVKIGHWYHDENSVWEHEIGVGFHSCVTHWIPAPERQEQNEKGLV